jgi:3-dehydroquinate synthase
MEPHLLGDPERWLPAGSLEKRLVIITDKNVEKYYGNHLLNQLINYKPLLLSFPPGEKSKNYRTKQTLEEEMLRHHCGKDTLILALGGGVVGDMAGFIAATYMRGISYIQIPTTLLAIVDSSIGGKTGINTKQGKNLIGTFWHPTAVVIDMNCLLTLPQAHLINGLVEVFKIFITSDKDSFNEARHGIHKIMNRDFSTLENIIQRALKIKIDIITQDEKDNNLRMILNFGHTIGHALEKIMNYTLLHGYAVALGILVEAKIAELAGWLSAEDYQSIQSVFLNLGIAGSQLKKININTMMSAIKIDKKNKSGQARYVLLNGIGQTYRDNGAFVHAVSDDMVKKALASVSEA